MPTETLTAPRLIEDDVYFCAFNSAKSYGANSYFVRHPAGNWLIDSPRFVPALVESFQGMGGLRYIFLTHRDDVGDAGLFAKRFGAERIIHEADQSASPGAEIIVRGRDPMALAAEVTIIPVPGHTEGHCVLLYKNKFLFTGDHLAWDPADGGALEAYRDYCWFDWKEQIRSMERLRDHRFEWVLPGHGRRINLPADAMQVELTRLIDKMKI